MDEILEFIIDNSNSSTNETFENVPDILIIATALVVVLMVLIFIVSIIVSLFLAIAYIRFNFTANSIGKTGEEIARLILNKYGLNDIRISSTGSILFGNSYSHYFRKVRLRRRTLKKRSVSALAMASQKSSLAIMDKEKDGAMRLRIILTPLIYFGPVAFVPMVIIGIILDAFVLSSNGGLCIVILTLTAFVFYVISFIMSIAVLKTEKKAQQRSLQLISENHLANADEIIMCKRLYRLYNIEYVNNMIVALLELIYRILQLFMFRQKLTDGKDGF